MVRVILFDVNETLLDIRALNPLFEMAFGQVDVMKEWFGELLRAAFVATITNQYADFATLGRAALTIVAERRGTSLSGAEQARILAGMHTLPAHAEVPESLARLQEAGWRLATLTNSPPAVVEAQLDHAGLSDFFERALSVDAVRRFKPAPEPYHYAAEQLAVEVGELLLVAAHDWDVTGAMAAGCQAAFVARPGMVLNPLGPRPRIIGSDLRAVAEQIQAMGDGA